MVDKTEIENRILKFKENLQKYDVPSILDLHIAQGGCFYLSDELHIELKKLISVKYEVQLSDVVVVGSAKLGFSISPDKPYKEFDEEKSDIDIAIISPPLFEKFWLEAYKFRQNRGFWRNDKLFSSFTKYLFLGWIRPDFFPPAYKFDLGKDWWVFFQTLERGGKFGSIKIRAGVYKSRYHFDTYHSKTIQSLKNFPEKDVEL